MALTLSILYSDEAERGELPGAREAFAALEIDRLLEFRNTYRYYTRDADVIDRRMNVMLDVVRSAELYDFLRETQEELRGLELEAQSLQTKQIDTVAPAETLISQLFIIKLYVGILDKLGEKHAALTPAIKSKELDEFFKFVEKETSDEKFCRLRDNLGKLDRELINIKSVTIGLNLDSQLRIREAGLVSFHSEPFKSGNIIDKLLRGEFKKTEFDCLAPLTIMAGEEDNPKHNMVNEAVRRVLGEAFRDSLRSWKQPIKQFIADRAARFAGLADEIKFILSVADYLKKLENAKLAFCKPKICKTGSSLAGLYNPFLLGATDKIVKNSISFEDCSLYILTGANSGGKSVFTYSVGIAQALFQCGIPVPAISAEMRVCDRIFIRTPASEDKSAADHIKNAEGRLENEVKAVMSILPEMTGESLIILDEVFASTGAEDAIELAKIYCIKLLNIGATTIFTTHLHGLAKRVGEINAASAKYKADTLSAGSSESDRYHIRSAAPEGRSFAMKIAEKYGLV